MPRVFIDYGNNSGNFFLSACNYIAEPETDVVDYINNYFFDGGPVDPKPLSEIVSLYAPQVNGALAPHKAPKEQTVTIEKSFSYSALLGYVEAIPFLGIVLGVINSLGHALGYYLSKQRLNTAIKEQRNDNADGLIALETFRAAVQTTIHYNHLIGSMLSIVPFVKPIVRLGQVIANERDEVFHPL